MAKFKKPNNFATSSSSPSASSPSKSEGPHKKTMKFSKKVKSSNVEAFESETTEDLHNEVDPKEVNCIVVIQLFFCKQICRDF